MGNGDNFALDWIRGELESTLDQARAALESYAEGGREETRLRSCLTSLHQVHGTLRMLELDGVVLLADHMEQTAQSLLNGSIQESLSAEQSLMQSILQLPAFIEEVQNGLTEDLPLVMPYVNELRSCCGLSAMQLTPQISAEFTAEQAADVMRRFRGIDGADKAVRVRAAYQQVLLSVLKGGASAQTVETLGKIAIGMQRICEGAPLATLWKALEHYAKGYESDPQKMSSEAIRDLRRVDAEMKRVATQGAQALVEPLPVELVRDLLRAAEARGQRDEKITELRSAVQTPQASQVKPREALEQAGEVLAEEIAAVRDRFDLFARGSDRDLAELVELTTPLDNICSTLGMLGDQHGADLLRAQRAQVLALDENSAISEEVIVDLANALVQTEQGLTNAGEIASSDEALSDAALNEAQVAVLQEARSGIDQVKQNVVDFVSSKWNAGYLDESPVVLAAVQGALRMIPLPRAAELLASCSVYVSEQLLQGHRPDWQELDAFADALGGIDYYLERLFETGRVPDAKALDLTEESLSRLAKDEKEVPVAEVPGDDLAAADSTEELAPLDGAEGSTALTAMLGARPEELEFLPDAVEGTEHEAEQSEGDQSQGLAAELQLESVDADEPVAKVLELETTEISEESEFDSSQTDFVDSSPSQESGQEGGNDSAQSPGVFAAGALLAAGTAAGVVATTTTTTRETATKDIAEPPQDSAVSQPIPEAVDPEIVEIFVEEVGEILEAIEAQLPDWSQNLVAETPLSEIRRNCHTLKGSGRIVGANQIGELGWALENMLNRLLDDTIAPTEDHLFIVSHACTIVPQLRDDFAAGLIAERPELTELLEQVDVLASGGVLSSALANASAATNDVSSPPEELDEEDFPIWDDAGFEADAAAQAPSPPNIDVPDFLSPDDSARQAILLSGGRAADQEASEFNSSSPRLFAVEVQEHLEVLSSRVKDSLVNDQLELDSPFTRALHTITGSAATAGESAVVGIAEPLQDVASVVLRERNGVIDGEYLAFVREGVYALQRLLDVDAPAADAPDDSAMFAAEAERLLGGLLEASDASTSLLEMDDTAVLLDAREFLDGWRFGAMDLARAEQMSRALTCVIERAHSEEFAELAEILFLAHGQFADQPLDEGRHHALVAAHDDLLVQLDALAADQVAVMTIDSRERLQDLLSAAPAPTTSPTEALDVPVALPESVPDAQEEQTNIAATEPLDGDAEEAIAYELDQSDAFDLGALDDDIFRGDEAEPNVVDSQIPAPQVNEPQVNEPQVNAPQVNAPRITEPQIAAPVQESQPVAAAIQPSHDQSDDAEEDDPELLAIFLEEADEILEEFDHNVQGWSSDRTSKLYLENLLRGLHTLKGGARLTGLTAIGDMTHDFESELIELQNGDAQISDVQLDAVQNRYDELVGVVAHAKNNDPQEPAEAAIAAESESAVDVLAQVVETGFATDVEAALSAEAIAEQKAASVEPSMPVATDVDEVAGEEIVEVVPLVAAANDLDIPVPPAFVASGQLAKAEVSGAQEEDRSRSSQEMVRVSASLLENLVNLAGESSIVRARVEQGISDFGGALEEMETTIERVREQLRRLELETETRVSSRVEGSSGPSYDDFDPLEMDRYSQLQQLTRSLTESATDMMDLKETLRYRARESETLLLQQARLNTELQEGLMRTRMVPFSRLMPRLRRIARQVSRDLDKQVEFQAYNAEGELDRNVLERMLPALEHMLRNAVDHGIESADLRNNFGKPAIGRIGLKLLREGGDVVIEITDDGAGIDVETVRAKAVERELMAPDAALTDEQVLDFVLAPGFSTAKEVTQISGRGVGLDVVHSEVKQLGGSIEISSIPGQGTTFTVRLPFTVSVNRALMVTLGDDQYAIPLNTIEGIVLLPSEELSQHYGPESTPFEYAGVPYRVRYLGSYLGREYVPRGEQLSVPVVLVRSGDRAVAVHVDDVQGSREIVVKSLGPQFAGVGGISGATILGDGSVVIILDLLSLMRARGSGKNVELRQPAAEKEERWVLVVDDSVTVRKVTSRLLERQGMNVMTAKDGVEAVSVLQERQPDIVLLDIEMPRMDGFEVARQMQRDERLADIPIVMISSRTGDKHTERARSLGVKRFLGKPFQENELLEVIDELVTRS